MGIYHCYLNSSDFPNHLQNQSNSNITTHLIACLKFALIVLHCAHANQSSGKFSMPKPKCNRWTTSIGLTIFAITTSVVPADATQHGKASWYAMTSITASGERASPNTMTAAHRTLDFGTQIRVTNIRNGRSVILCVNDRGPFIKGRIVDVTKVAARKLGFENAGWTNVRIDVTGHKSRRCS